MMEEENKMNKKKEKEEKKIKRLPSTKDWNTSDFPLEESL